MLIYAEALNELSSGTNYEIPSWDDSKIHVVSRNISEMKKGVRPIRIRAGLPDYSEEVYSDPVKLRMKLKREWQIEFLQKDIVIGICVDGWMLRWRRLLQYMGVICWQRRI